MLPNGIAFREWAITSEKGHMLESRCHTPDQCKAAETEGSGALCNYCR